MRHSLFMTRALSPDEALAGALTYLNSECMLLRTVLALSAFEGIADKNCSS
jgi:hypothetical protein